MSKQDYGWKRFWCPRSGSIALADGGYLSDPDAEWSRAYNPNLVSLEAIADIPCLVLLGEPGIGKSQELENLKAFTEEKICDSSQILELNFRSCTNLKEDLFKDETFTDWLSNSYHLYLFLDSLDEGLLSISTLATGLVDELKKSKYQNHIDRLHLRLACRTFVFPAILEEGLKSLWKEANWAIYELAPLRRIDVIRAAKAESFSSDDFLKEIDQKDAVPLAIKPITLRFLLNTYRRHNGQFPPEQRLYDFYLEGCKLLCEEVNESRHASDRAGNFDSDQRLIVAARIAAVTIFANRFAVWTSVDKGDVPAEDILLQSLCFSYEKANGREFEITKEVIKEVLDTGLFSSRGLNRMGWAHQTYAEFLAAWYLTQYEIPLAKIMELVYSYEDTDCKLIPQLHETAAWLASMRSDVLQEIIETDPAVTLQTDVPTDAKVRASIVDNLLTQYEEGKLFDRGRNNYRHYAKLKHPGLVEQLRPYICDSGKQIDAQELAIDLAEVCEVSELQDELAELALDSSQSIYLRVSAAKAICSVGNAATRLRLKPLVIAQLSEDTNDRLKGYALQSLWPDHLTAEELFQVLTPPKKRNFFGGYQWFINYELVQQLRPEHLVVAFDWLKRQGLKCFGHPFQKLGDALLFKAWENFDLPGVAESFTQVALAQWKRYERIITDGSTLEQQFTASLLYDIGKRHTLVEQAVLSISGTGEDLFFLLSSSTENILVSEDIFWMLEKLQASSCKKTQKIWAQLIRLSFNDQDVKQIDAIIVATQANSILQKIFSPYFTPIELNSSQSKKLRADHLRAKERQACGQDPPLLDPSPRERVLQCLEKLEAGDLAAWWQLNMEMTLRPDSTHYDNEFELDLTKLPGWQEAEEATQNRIIEGAKSYTQNQSKISYLWIRKNTYNCLALAGARALGLLLKKCPHHLDSIAPEVWRKWAPVVIAFPCEQQDSFHSELVKITYLNAPRESINTLILLIDKDSCNDHDISSFSQFKKAWDTRLKLALLEKAKDPLLNPRCVGQLLEELLKQGLTEAEEFAKSLIVLPLPSTEYEREKALIAARVLVENSHPSSWAFIWSFIQQHTSFGREVLELFADRYSHGIKLNLTEAQLADLYIWLVHQYPYEQDPDHSNAVMAQIVNTRDGMANLRDDVLTQLKEKGTLQACDEIRRIIKALPDITWLGKILIDAQVNMRRMAWKPMMPEEFLQFIIIKEPSNLDLSNQLNVIDQRTKKMEDEPKTENNFNISGSHINAPFGNSGETHSYVTTSSSAAEPSSEAQAKVNWGNWLAVIAILVTIISIPLSMGVSGAFNEEFRQLLNRIFPSQVEQEFTPQAN